MDDITIYGVERPLQPGELALLVLAVCEQLEAMGLDANGARLSQAGQEGEHGQENG